MFKAADKAPSETNALVSWWFFRGLGLIYFGAFASMAVQIQGLIGSDGILPVQEYLDRIAAILSEDKYWKFPTLFWLDTSDPLLTLACYAGMAAAVLVFVNLCVRLGLIACFVLYLSIAVAGQDFTAFQWDAFLLESGFMAILLTFRSKIVFFLYRLLIARFMFMGGVVKIASGDPAWADLTALSYHYLTQPLPSPLAYYVYFLPDWLHKVCTAGVLLIELPIPFLVFMPRPFRLFAAWSFILLQSSIMLTGNYNFFNLLALLLCLFLFDGRDLRKVTPSRLTKRILATYQPSGRFADGFAGVWASLVLLVLTTHIWLTQSHRQPAAPLQKLVQLTMAFNMVINYGPFAVMTTRRDEVIVEGSQDGLNWQEYGFKYKPDALDKPLNWNIPHQPRLDWQLWFIPLAPGINEGWLDNFLRRLQQNSPAVVNLLARNPFPNDPPKFIRARLFRYTFAPPEVRAKTGQIWLREDNNATLIYIAGGS